MRLNSEKWTFGVSEGKFLSFYLTEQGIEANPDKCGAVIQMISLSSKKEVQKLNDMFTTLNIFISKYA